MIKQYIRESETNRKIGVLVGMKIDGNISIGFSVLHKNDVGKWDPAFGSDIAEDRAIRYSYGDRTPKIPYKIEPNFLRFINRCKTYFKDGIILPWIDEVEDELIENIEWEI